MASQKSHFPNADFQVTFSLPSLLVKLPNNSIVVTLYKIGEVYFRLRGMNGFHAKAKNERFTAESPRCPQNL